MCKNWAFNLLNGQWNRHFVCHRGPDSFTVVLLGDKFLPVADLVLKLDLLTQCGGKSKGS